MASSTSAISTSASKIQDLECGEKLVSLLGVVTTFRPPSKSHGSRDFSCSLELVDESEKKIKCSFFGPESSLPQQCPVGSIVRLKKVAVEEHEGHKRLLAHSKLSQWAILEVKSDGSVSVSACSGSLLSDADKQRGRTLKEWAEQTNLVPGPSTSQATSSSSSLLPVGGRVCPPMGGHDQYTVQLHSINQLAFGMKNVGLCGLVKCYKPPSRSKGQDYYTMVHIVDESSPSTGIKCLIFNTSKDKLANVGRVGAVALIKGVCIQTQKDTEKLQACGHEHTLVGMFAGEVSDIIPNQIGSWYDLTTAEKKRVQELRLWSKREGPFLLNTKLKEVTPNHYFNMICQVAAMAILEEQKTTVLSVTDGTTSKMPCRELNLAETSEQDWVFDSIPEIYYRYRLLTCDVWITNIDQLDVRAGDVIHMKNMFSHRLPRQAVQGAATVESPRIELRVFDHEGSITQLEEELAVNFVRSLPIMYGVFPWCRSRELYDFDEENEGIVQTIVNDSTPQATLEEIRKADIGSEFLANVEVRLIRPRGLDAICVPVCPLCGDKGIDDQAENTNSPTCPKDGATLVYKPITFSLLVSDESGELEVSVDSQESQRLFSKTFSNNIAVNQETKRKIESIFYQLTDGNDPFFAVPADPRYSYSRPVFQCAIKKAVDPSTASNGEQSCKYFLVNTVIGK